MALAASDIVFVFPPAPGHVALFTNHLGVAYLRAVLAASSVKSRQYVNRRPGTIAEVARDVLSSRPEVVGFTAYDANFRLCLAIASAIKQQRPSTRVILGGPTATFNARELLRRHAAIDLYFEGETEEIGPSVIRGLIEGKYPRSDQTGVAFRFEGELICNPSSPLVGGDADPSGSLDIVPSPYLSGILEDGNTGILTGRGCTHRCQYCCFAALARNKLRLHSIERVLAELHYIHEHQRRTGRTYAVSILDDAFTLLPERAKALCDEIVRSGLKLKLSCLTRADTIDDELLQLMRAAGFVSVSFGLESAVPSVLRASGKVRPPDCPEKDLTPERLFLEQVRQSVISAKKLGFHVGVSIILGLPKETPADGEATLRFVQSLPVDSYTHNFLRLIPGTPLWETQRRHNLQCAIDDVGLPGPTKHTYEVTRLRPGKKCVLEEKAAFVRELAADSVHDCQSPGTGRDGFSTIVIHADEVNADLAKWLQSHLEVGGTVLQLYPPLNKGKREQNTARDRQTVARNLVPHRYYIQLFRKRAGSDQLTVATSGLDLYQAHKPSLVSINSSRSSSPMLEWMRSGQTTCELCEVPPDVLRSGELKAFDKLVRSTSKSFPLEDMAIPPRITYPGRWLQEASSCKSLSRVEVDSEGHIRCCWLGEPLGTVADSKQDLLDRFSQFVQAAEQRRGCGSCTVKECPRCTFPGVDDQTYCETIKQSLPLLRTLGLVQVCSRLMSTVARQQDLIAAE